MSEFIVLFLLFVPSSTDICNINFTGTNGYNSQSDGEGQFATPRMFDSGHVQGEHKRSNSINSVRSNGSQNLLAENYHRQNLASHAQLLHR